VSINFFVFGFFERKKFNFFMEKVSQKFIKKRTRKSMFLLLQPER